MFYEKDRQIVLSHGNKPLYVTAYICDIKLSRKMVDPSSSLNIMPLSMLKVVGVPQERHRTVHQCQVSKATHRSLLATLTLTWLSGLCKQVLNSMLLMLEPPVTCYCGDYRSTGTKLSLSRNTNAWKTSGETKRFMSRLWMPILVKRKLIFQRLHFDELADDGEIIQNRPRAVPLTIREDHEEQKSKLDEFASTSAQPPRTSKQLKLEKITITRRRICVKKSN